MHKHIFSSIGCLLIACMVKAQEKPFTIQGNITGKTGGYMYLSYPAASGYKTDSSLIRNGKFAFKGMLDGAADAYVSPSNSRIAGGKGLRVMIEPADMKLSVNYDKFDEGVLTGSSVQEEMNILNRMKASAMAKLKPMNEAYNKLAMEYSAIKEKDGAKAKELKEKMEAIKEEMAPYQRESTKADNEFMDKYPASMVTANILQFAVSRMPVEEGKARYEKLSPSAKKSRAGLMVKESLEGMQAGSPGAKAFNFTSTELRGETLSLSGLKGKYVLIDFWASWCVPCRKGNPHLLSLYAKYKDKGLEIVGVSDDDRAPEKWKQAVEQDGIGVWKHVLRGLKSEGMTFDRTNSISDKYGIHSLPTKVLVDPNGMIIGRYGGGGGNDADMDRKLAEIFGS